MYGGMDELQQQTAGCDPGAVSSDPDQASEARLPVVHRHRGAGTGASTADRERHPNQAMVAHVLVARYADHLPLYRQAQILARQGVILERSTLSFWMKCAAAEVAPVVARPRMMLASTRIFADETVVPVLDPGRGRTKQGYFWAIARDDRPWSGSQLLAVVYMLCSLAGVISTPTRCSVATAASCSAMATGPTRRSPAPNRPRRPQRWPFAGAIIWSRFLCGVAGRGRSVGRWRQPAGLRIIFADAWRFADA